MTRLSALIHRRRRLVLALALATVVLGAVWGTSVFSRLYGGGFDTPGSESAIAARLLNDQFGRQGADVAVVYRSEAPVTDPDVRAAIEGALASLDPSDVVSVTSYFETGSPALISADERSTLVLIQLAGGGEDAIIAAYERIAESLVVPGVETLRGGDAAVFQDVNDQIAEDLERAETLSLPIVLVLLLVVFGSVAAAMLPLAIGVLAILGAFTALRVISEFTDISVYSINIITMLGLGLAIDYSLFVVTRFREEMAARGSTRAVTRDALAATMQTAGRTVLFSGITVAVSLTALLFFAQGFLRSMGYGAISAVVVAMLAALTVLPALLAALGPRVDALRIGRRRAQPTEPGHGGWARVASAVMHRPVLVAVATTTVLVILAIPFSRILFGGIDARVLPADTESRVASEVIESEFVRSGANAIDVVMRADSASVVQQQAGELSQALAALPGATGASVVAVSGDVAHLNVAYAGSGADAAARDLVAEIRAQAPPGSAEVLVGGGSAELADLLASIGSRLPWAAGFVIGTTLLLLFLAFGSLVLPVKAVLMNLLSLSAMFGVVVWVFQEGHLAGLFGATPMGTIEATQPVLMVAIAFGLSMDYEVFLLSRIRERWDATGDNVEAVATGLQQTGRIVTSAALLLVVVIGAFATSGISFITMIGVGLAVAILLDATVVRMLLVPATMRLLGGANWWLPAPLQHWWERWGVRESGHPIVAGPVGGTVGGTGAGTAGASGEHRAAELAGETAGETSGETGGDPEAGQGRRGAAIGSSG